MSQRIVNDNFWTDTWVEDRDPSEKLIYLYLLTNPLCNIAGAYEIKLKRIAYETGYDRDTVNNILNRFVEMGKIVRWNDWILIVNFVKNQSSNNPSVLKGIQRIIDGLPIELLTACIHPVHRLVHFTLLNLTLPNLTLPNSTEDSDFSGDDFSEEKIGDDSFPTKNLVPISEDSNVPPAIKTPAERAKYFFGLSPQKISEEMKISEDSKEFFENEIKEFQLYWTEKNKSGTKERWETEKTFEVDRRLSRWFSNKKFPLSPKNEAGTTWK